MTHYPWRRALDVSAWEAETASILNKTRQQRAGGYSGPFLLFWVPCSMMPSLMQRIPEETIQQVLAATNIVDVIGRVVTLKRAGTNYQGLCPFHTERTPSLRVHVETGAFRCMACGAHGGDLIAFHMQRRNVDFKTACIALGCWTGGRRHA